MALAFTPFTRNKPAREPFGKLPGNRLPKLACPEPRTGQFFHPAQNRGVRACRQENGAVLKQGAAVAPLGAAGNLMRADQKIAEDRLEKTQAFLAASGRTPSEVDLNAQASQRFSHNGVHPPEPRARFFRFRLPLGTPRQSEGISNLMIVDERLTTSRAADERKGGQAVVAEARIGRLKVAQAERRLGPAVEA